MSLPKYTEEIIYQAVVRGELEIDNEGRIWRVKTRTGSRWGKGVIVNPCQPRRAEHYTGDYLQVRVMVKWIRTHCLAHRLVWRHFNGSIPEGLTINHKDGDKKNNRLGNLELVTYSGNTRHMLDVLKKGRVLNQSGEMNSQAKLTNKAVGEIRSMAEQIESEMKTRHGHRIQELADKYGVNYHTIWDVFKRNRWSNL